MPNVKTPATENDTIKGDVTIKEAKKFYGVVEGTVTVAEGGSFDLQGIVDKDVIVLKGGEITIHGQVRGNAYNKGGSLQIYGIVRGDVHREGGRVLLGPDAIVEGNFVQDKAK